MSTNPNTQQINVFSKGMNTDTSDAYISSELYRYAENLRPVTNLGETGGELRLIEGYKQKFDLQAEDVLAVTSIRNLVVFLVNIQNNAEILVWNTETDKINIVFSAKGKWTSEHYSLVTRYEDEDNIKLYVADGINLLRAFAIHEGATNPDSFDDIDTAGGINVFKGFGDILRISGQLKPGIVQYAYILYTKYKGTSAVSPSTKPLSVYESSDPHKGVMPDFRTSVGFLVEIKENTSTTTYEKILVYRITYTEVGQQPEIDLIFDDDLQDNNYIFVDKGQEPITSNTTFAEFVALSSNLDVVPNYIESKNDYLFVANLKYNKDNLTSAIYDAWDPTTLITDNGYLDFDTPFPLGTGVDSSFDRWMQCESDNLKWTIRFEEIDENNPEKNLLTDNHTSLKTLQHDEIYRYGIILYDKYGQKYPPKWFADIRTPSEDVCPSVVSYNGDIYTRPLYLEVTVKGLSSDLFPYYEIVRCDRTSSDIHNISLGIVGKTMRCFTSEDEAPINNNYYPSGFMGMWDVTADSYDKVKHHDVRVDTFNTDVYMFSSPEVCYNSQAVDDIVHSYNNLNIKLLYNSKVNVQKIDESWVRHDGQNEAWIVANSGNISTVDVRSQGLVKFGDSGLYLKNKYAQAAEAEVSGGNYIWCHPDSNFSHGGTKPAKYNGVEFLYVYPSQNIFESNGLKINVDKTYIIDKIKFVDSPRFDEFAQNGEFIYNNSSTYIGGRNFVNWSTAMIQRFYDTDLWSNVKTVYSNGRNPSMGINNIAEYDAWGLYVYEHWAYRYPIGSGGKCLIFTTNGDSLIAFKKTGDLEVGDLTVATLLNKNITPYGGESSRDRSIFVSHGQYFKNNGAVNSVYDGDCFILKFYYNALHTWEDDTFIYAPRMSTVCIVPIETRIDLNSDSGASYKRVSKLSTVGDKYIRYIQDYVSIMNHYTQDENAYMYNTAYSAEPTLQVSSAISKDDFENDLYDYRVHVSLLKTNNEKTDSWLNYKSGDFIDVDTRYGEITDLRLFKNTLMFWLKDATGVLSVNERTMLQDVNETNIILGNGDVLLRYDYLTTEYGMKPEQQVEALSDTTLYWWDEYRKEILMYAGGQSVVPMKKTKLISALINKSTPLTKPIMTYDHKYNEILMNIVNIPYEEYLKRFTSELPVSSFDGTHNVQAFEYDMPYPIVYSELIQLFVSIYTTPFEHSVAVSGDVYMIHDNKMLKWNQEGVDLYPLLRYIVNANSTFTKTYDNIQLGMGEMFYYDEFYNSEPDTTKRDNQPLSFRFRTIGQLSTIDKNITNREYDLRFAIPRDNDQEYGGRMRGKTMQCELTSSSSSTDFSIRYIITKYRISWS